MTAIKNLLLFFVLVNLSLSQEFAVDTFYIEREWLGKYIRGDVGKVCYNDSICEYISVDALNYIDGFLLRWSRIHSGTLYDSYAKKYNKRISLVYCHLHDTKNNKTLLDTIFVFFPGDEFYAPMSEKLYKYKNTLWLIGEYIYIYNNGKLHSWNEETDLRYKGYKWTSAPFGKFYQPFGRGGFLYLHTYEGKLKMFYKFLKKHNDYSILRKYVISDDITNIREIKGLGGHPTWNKREFIHKSPLLARVWVDTLGDKNLIYELYPYKDTLVVYDTSGKIVRKKYIGRNLGFWINKYLCVIRKQSNTSYFVSLYDKNNFNLVKEIPYPVNLYILRSIGSEQNGRLTYYIKPLPLNYLQKDKIPVYVVKFEY